MWVAGSNTHACVLAALQTAPPEDVAPAAMLRLVNVHDVVPDVPPALVIRPFRCARLLVL